MQINKRKPPSGTRRVYKWDDLPATTADCAYTVENPGAEPIRIVVSKKRRRVLEGLMRSPLFAASYARLSDHVDHLKRSGVDIETLMFKSDPETGRDTYGFYVLRSIVTRSVRERRAAA